MLFKIALTILSLFVFVFSLNIFFRFLLDSQSVLRYESMTDDSAAGNDSVLIVVVKISIIHSTRCTMAD